MTIDNNSPEIGVQPRERSVGISAELLLEWYGQQKVKVDGRSEELRRIVSTDQGAEKDPDVTFMAGRVDGAYEVLRSFGDFLVKKSKP